MEKIEESDNDLQDIGYHSKTKRRKLEDDEEEETSAYAWSSAEKRKNSFKYLPTELLQTVFEYISYRELGQTVRLVCRRFKIIAEDMLNNKFKQIDKRLNIFLRTTQISLGYTTDTMEFRCITKLLNMLEQLKNYYDAIFVTIWRYVFNEYYQVKKTCMYAGDILDLIAEFFTKFVTSPDLLYRPTLAQEWTWSPEISIICHLTKKFCVHFDEVTEETQQRAVMSSGCKLVDLLDLASFAEKTEMYRSTEDGMFNARYSYVFHKTWFATFPVRNTRPMSGPQKNRMMYLRLRRIVMAHNEINLQQFQVRREEELQLDADHPVMTQDTRNNSIYTGYGDVEDTFYYYGVMSEGAYRDKFGQPYRNEEEENENEAPSEDGTKDEMHLHIDVEVTCPLPYAPLSYLKELDEKARQELKSMTSVNRKGEHYMKVSFFERFIQSVRLPLAYDYVLPYNL